MENVISNKRLPLEDLLAKLKMEEAIVAKGGYGPSVRTPQVRLQAFRDSISCLNFASESLEPCDQCWLMDFVPGDHHQNTLPCHHIALNESGETVASLTPTGDPGRLQQALLTWLRSNIAKVEQELKQPGDGRACPPR